MYLPIIDVRLVLNNGINIFESCLKLVECLIIGDPMTSGAQPDSLTKSSSSHFLTIQTVCNPRSESYDTES